MSAFVLAPRVCKRCEQTFQPTARCQKYCGRPNTPNTCSWLVAQESIKKAQAKFRAKKHANVVVQAPMKSISTGEVGVLEPRICQLCEKQYQPTAHVQKYCGKQKERGSCSWQASQNATKKWMADNPEKMHGYRDTWWSNLIADPPRYQKYLERCRRKDLKRQGMTQEQYDAKLMEQGRLCAICRLPHGRSLAGRSKDLAIDHDHVTGQLRGLLCDDCNIGLGLFRDDPQRMMNAALYILYYKDIGGYPLPEMISTQERVGSLPWRSQK